ncbi:amidohydrolase [Arthrobacter caoxuetaonis]|uniref:Amidohydrolase n=1 Tax=Arthrobacter caoxuetaonis TaxID=2886935 RepID=A0A9X1SED6_9MICC|nr:amidohydrolase [Arthrobacter caoxuetaonis]MCC3297524.1 amidohydrolase [Arthrobacter caoxuetaonis]USQ57945.1 amidohydrolase [Arthrobacter caoxuetaonis]
MRTLYTNGIVFTATGPHAAGLHNEADAVEPPTVEAFVVENGRFLFAGDTAPAAQAAGDGATTVDLGGAFVLPGIIDAHTHLLMTGQALGKVQLRDAETLADLQERLRQAVRDNPALPRVLGSGWLHSALGGAEPTRDLLDAAVPDRPVYLDSNDLHSVWVNSAALAELGIDGSTPDPLGGRIGRGSSGTADGMLYETAAVQIVWPALANAARDEDRDAWLEAAFAHYAAAGVTGAVDMAVGDDDVAAFTRALVRHGGTLPLRVKGHWLIHRRDSTEENLAQVARAQELAAELAANGTAAWLQLCGIKVIVDGVIDSCTAAMKEPYADGSTSGPIWDREALFPVVAAADAAGLQVALHAIGDEASDIALDALEHAVRVNGPADTRRHRIEHLETVTEANVQRLADLGVVASVQPVHADPAIQDNWRAMLGDDRTERAYPWTEFSEAGAVLAISTDAPTAPYQALPNLYVAATRKSAMDPELVANLPRYAMDLADALCHATRDAAYSCRAEASLGQIRPGHMADFTVLAADPLAGPAEDLLANSVLLTVTGGRTVFSAAADTLS